MTIRRAFTAPIRWAKDDLLRRLVRNAGVLLSGSMAASALQLISLAVTARALGPEQFGLLALITAYVLIVDGLFNFQSWQAFIKYGTDALSHDRIGDFRCLVKIGFVLDGTTALIGGSAAAIAVYLVAPWFGWSRDLQIMTMLYSLIICFHVAGTVTGVLRVYGSFKILAGHQFLSAISRTIGVMIAFFAGWDLPGFLLIWAVSDIFSQVLLVGLGLRELQRRDVKGVLREPLRSVGKKFPAFWLFIWTTNLNGSIRSASRELDTLVIGYMLGPAAAGLFKIAKQYSLALAKFSDPLYQAIFPDLSRLYSTGQVAAFRSLIRRSACLAGAGALLIWLVFFFGGGHILTLTAGPDYIDAYGVLIIHMLGTSISVFAFPLQPAMLSMGRPMTTFYVHIVSATLHIFALWACLSAVGLSGAGVAYVFYYLCWTGLMLYHTSRFLKLGESE